MDNQSQQTEGNWVGVAREDELANGRAIEFVSGPWVVAVFQINDQFYALDGMCAHQGGPIAKGEITGEGGEIPCVTCPWHGWQYELKTGIQTINRQPLQRTFPVRVIDGMVQVQLPDDAKD